jgi:hypothetical protein
MHVVQSTVTLSAPQNESNITLLVSGENERLTEIIQEMCRRAVQYAIEPLQQVLHEDLQTPEAIPIAASASLQPSKYPWSSTTTRRPLIRRRR